MIRNELTGVRNILAASERECPMSAVVLSPSLLSADFSRLGEELAALEQAGVTWLHNLDIMDGNFVPNITFGAPLIKSIRKKCDLFSMSI